ncbi:ScbA/BarX family gamma-butyrolactone biosynthesis protein [Streptomyces sp. TRM70308]|uniref:ScbA/BarX family gamma-butyrolactone biosynthesis protein n=1 Tax=Streptomyces sp. TRM70308 TaxID=3131932 RepID=UPI003CFE8B15
MTASTFRVEHPTAGTGGAGGAAAARAAAEPPLFRFPSLTTTVPKEFVHRAAVAEVMLTDWQRRDGGRFEVMAQWPRGHSFFTPVGDHHDPMLAAETIRQVGSLLAHAEFGVPLGHHFLMRDLAFTVRPAHLLVGDAPAALDLDITCSDVSRRGRQLTGMRYDAVIRRDGQVAATGSASYTCTTPAVYRRLRGARGVLGGGPVLPLTAPAAPESVGRRSPVDVVLSPGGRAGRWQLRVDTRHPVLFDHPVDHVPGMVLIEAARQAAAALLGRPDFVPAAVESEFSRYAELDAPTVVEARRAEPGEGGSVVVTGYQDGEPLFRSTVS